MIVIINYNLIYQTNISKFKKEKLSENFTLIVGMNE